MCEIAKQELKDMGDDKLGLWTRVDTLRDRVISVKEHPNWQRVIVHVSPSKKSSGWQPSSSAIICNKCMFSRSKWAYFQSVTGTVPVCHCV